MRWPDDHPAVTDPALTEWAGEVDRLCPDAEVVRVLRHLPGRRVTTLLQTPSGLAVLKLFATSRARGGHRRLAAFAESPAAPFLPRSLGNRKGHLLLVDFVPGVPFTDLGDDALAEASRMAGRALRSVHDSGVVLGRTWGVTDEIAQLRRTAGPATRAVVERAIARWTPSEGEPPVPSHRDCHPAQVIRTENGVLLVDLDDSAMAPRGIDAGNFVAHLEMDAHVGRRTSEGASEAIDAFLGGYGFEPPSLDSWTRLSLARLAALAETRHRSVGQAQVLAAAVDRILSVGHGRPA